MTEAIVMKINQVPSEHLRLVLAMMSAIDQGRVIKFDYNGTVREVEVHAVGVSTAGNPVMRGWQINGGSLSGNHAGWKLFDLEKVPETYSLTDTPSLTPRKGYRHDDAAMVDIFRQV